ncbi:MAG: ABC transporter substrate-binding protein, partial [Thermoplasmata archaeon]
MHRIVKVSVIWLMLGLLMVHIPLMGDGDSSARSPQLLENIESLEIVAGSVLDIQTLNPCVASDEHTQRVLSLVYDSLAYINRTTGSAEPGLALSWTSSDGLTWIVKLRENLKWHDGTNLTADDVVFTYNFLLNPENPLKTSEYFSFLKWVRIPGTSDKNEDYWEAVQKVDRSTVKFVLNKTVWDFGITLLSLPILKKEIWKEHWGDATSWNLDHDVTTGTSKSIGSGPYKLISWKPGRELILVPNPDYHRTVKSSIRILKYSSYPDLLEGVRKREVSLVFHPVSLEFLPEFTQIGSFSAFPYRAREITFLGFNLEKYFEGYDEGSGYQQRSSIDDPVTYPVKAAGADAGLQFRNAAGYLLPNNLVEVKYPNILLWENSIVQRGSQYYNASVKSYSQDIEEAVRLLNIANYKDADGDEWREDYSGRKMGHEGVVKIYIEKKEPVNQQIAMWFCANLRSAGVNADTFPIQVLNYRDYDLFLYTLHLDENFEYVYKLLNSKYDYTDGVTNGENLWRYRNPDTDNLTTSMLSTQGFGNTIRYLQGIISIHLPLIPLYSRILYDVVDTARVSVNPVVNESLLEKHNIISMTVSDGVSIEAYGVPFRLNAIGGSISEIIVRVSQNENPVVDTQVMLSISPSDAIALDAQSKQTDSAGCAFFSLTLTKSMGLVQILSVECLLPSQNILKRFYLVLEPFEIEVNILSEPFVKGLANNTYTFSFEIRNSGVPVKDAFTQVLFVSDSRIKPLIGENLSDGSGVASLMFLVTEDYTENAPLQITFALSVAGGEEKAYSVTLVVTAPGSLEVSIAAACQGVNWKTGRGEITGLVNYEGNPVGAMTVKCGIMELDGIFEIESQERVTDSQGAVNFSVTMKQMPRKSRFFH